MTLFTIGHSNRTLEEFLDLLAAHGITQIIDVRSIPKSRYVPWTNQDSLKKSLQKAKINYHALPQLGGRRSSRKDSINQGWENKSFRGFADYMQTDAFFQGLKMLTALMKHKKTALMCAEAVPWRCHRSLISDALIIRGVNVFHIMTKTNLRAHTLTSFAVVDKNKRPIQIIYPGKNLELEI